MSHVLTGLDQHWTKADNTDCGGYRTLSGVGDIFTWSGACEDGLLSGPGQQMWLNAKTPGGKYEAQNVTAIITGTFDHGRLQGPARVATPTGYFNGSWDKGVFVAAVDNAPSTPVDTTPPPSPSSSSVVVQAPTDGVAPTSVRAGTYGLSDLPTIFPTYSDNRPKFMRLYAGQPFEFVGTLSILRQMNNVSDGYLLGFVPNGYSILTSVIFCGSIDDEATIDKANGWQSSHQQVRVRGTISDAVSLGLRLTDCRMQGL